MKKIILTGLFILAVLTSYSQVRINEVNRPTRFWNGTYFGENGVKIDSIIFLNDTLYFYVNSDSNPFKAVYNPSSGSIKASRGLTLSNDTIKFGGELDENASIDGMGYDIVFGDASNIGNFIVNSESLQLSSASDINFESSGLPWVFDGVYWRNASDTLTTFSDVRDLIFGELGISVENGLTITGSTIKQGGSLSENTTIQGGGYDHQIGSLSSRVNDFNRYGENYYSNMLSSYTWTINGVDELTFDGNQLKINFDTLITFDEARALIAASVVDLIIPYNYNYTFSASTSDSRPGVGYFRLNNATYSLVDYIYVDDYDENGISRVDFYNQVDTGSYITLTDGINYVNYQVIGVTDGGFYSKFNVSYKSNNGIISGSLTLNIDISNSTGSGLGALDTIYYENKGVWLGNGDTLTVDTLDHIIGDTLKTTNSAYLELNDTDLGSTMTITRPEGVSYYKISQDYPLYIITGTDTVKFTGERLYSDTAESIKLILDTLKLNGITNGIIYSAIQEDEELWIKNGNSSIQINNNGSIFLSSTTSGVGINSNYLSFQSIGSTKVGASLYSGTTNPTNTNRLNYDGNFHASALYANTSQTYSLYSVNNSSSSNSYGIYGRASAGQGANISSYYGTQLYIGHSDNMTGIIDFTSNWININRSPYNCTNLTGNIINIIDNPSGTGIISGKILSATIGSTERISLNPRTTTTGTAYILDTDSLMTTGAILSIRNQGTEIFRIDSTGIKTAVESEAFSEFNFDTATYTVHSEGRLYYDERTRGLILHDPNSGYWNISSELGERMFNPSGSQINNGDIVRLTGDTLINGYLYGKVELAGNSTSDSILVLGAATTNLASNGFGRVTFEGRLNDLNTTGLTGSFYLGNGGAKIDTSPPPPAFSVRLGIVGKTDNDSGFIYFNPSVPEYDPAPLFSADTSGLNGTVTITTQNVWEYLPLGNNSIDKNIGHSIVGDSVQIGVSGYYQIVLSMSFQGTVTAETWNYGIFVNNVLQHKKTRSTTSNAIGDANIPLSRQLSKDDWVSFRIRNTTGATDPTAVDMAVQILFLHL